tara:strand:- start:2438 stop:3715 length:1278 start_codon:yes stop_codon:yes gene_type:complete
VNNNNSDLEMIESFVKSSENELNELFLSRANQFYFKLRKILAIFKEEKLSTTHFQSSTGIGLDDISRDKIDNIFAKFFLSEKAAVRVQYVSGTHAISSVLFGVLRPGDTMLSITGSPYDTLEEVIGLRDNNEGSLKEFHINYEQIDLLDNKFNFSAISSFLKKNKCKLIFIQKSCGYTWRRSISNEDIRKICSVVHSINPNCICFVDNCYGELVENDEPIQNGANIIAGSLIKNLGGTVVPTGAYVAGESKLVELACCKLTAPGIGSNAGINFGLGRQILQGLFISPQMINQSLNSADLIALVFEKLGFKVSPHPREYRSDIIQAVQLNNPLLVQKICQSFQSSSPVDSFVRVMPALMNGYESNLIMSGGTFIEGSTSEFSADGPLREPYNIFIQGGSNIAHVKIALVRLLSDLIENNLIDRKNF